MIGKWVMTGFAMTSVLVQAFDFYSTKRLISKGWRESTPWIARAMVRFGTVPVLVVVKGAGIVLVVAIWFVCDHFKLYWFASIAYVILLVYYVRMLKNNIAPFTDKLKKGK